MTPYNSVITPCNNTDISRVYIQSDVQFPSSDTRFLTNQGKVTRHCRPLIIIHTNNRIFKAKTPSIKLRRTSFIQDKDASLHASANSSFSYTT